MARSNDSSNDSPVGGNHEQLNRKDQAAEANGEGARPGVSGGATSGADEGVPLEDGEKGRAPGARRLHKIAGSSHTLEGSAYQGAMEAVLVVPIAILLGYWADDYFGTTPRFVIVGAVVGFAAMVLRLVRMKALVGDAEASPDATSDVRREDGRRDGYDDENQDRNQD